MWSEHPLTQVPKTFLEVPTSLKMHRIVPLVGGESQRREVF